ncbi:MAG: hypothetical protein QM811_08700 [Pirellulales bacterium]
MAASKFGLHSLVKLAASPLPKPVQYAVSSRSRFYLSAAAVGAAMYFGIVHVDWSGGKPKVTVDQSKVQSLKTDGYELLQKGLQGNLPSFANTSPQPNGQTYVAQPISPATPIDRFAPPPTTRPLNTAANPGTSPWNGTTSTAGYSNPTFPSAAQPNRMVYPQQPSYGTPNVYSNGYAPNPAYGQPNYGPTANGSNPAAANSGAANYGGANYGAPNAYAQAYPIANPNYAQYGTPNYGPLAQNYPTNGYSAYPTTSYQQPASAYPTTSYNQPYGAAAYPARIRRNLSHIILRIPRSCLAIERMLIVLDFVPHDRLGDRGAFFCAEVALACRSVRCACGRCEMASPRRGCYSTNRSFVCSFARSHASRRSRFVRQLVSAQSHTRRRRSP